MGRPSISESATSIVIALFRQESHLDGANQRSPLSLIDHSLFNSSNNPTFLAGFD
jgi:hypothetical protein